MKNKKLEIGFTNSNIAGNNSYSGYLVEVWNTKLEVFQQAHKHICLLEFKIILHFYFSFLFYEWTNMD